ncbi:MAG TPA: peptidoglycan-binding protein [Gaiellaceae bacterium]|nr:peptidoglycan-binding protein [Gaiellaceae bacterium]
MRLRTLAVCLGVLASLLSAAPAAGITNPQIPGLQVALKAHGFYSGRIDGIAGPMTATGVRRFQRHAGLVADGVAGPLTRGKLGRLGRPLFGRRHLVMRGSVGWDVSVLEFFLRRRGFHPGRVDGRFSEQTRKAVLRYQRKRHLLVDGLVGPQTLGTFGVHRAVPQPTRSTLRHRGHGVRALLTYWARYYGINPRLVKALAWQESGFQPHVRSRAGATGVMQVTGQTWSYVEMILIGRKIPHTTNGNIHVGVAYLRQLLHEFDFDRRRAIGAYYQGSRAVRAHGLYRETRAFVANVLALRRRFS